MCGVAPEEVDDLVPECLAAVAIHQEVECLEVACPPLTDVCSTACLVAQHLAICEEQSDEDHDDADRIDRDEDGRHHCIGLVGAGIAVDVKIVLVEGLPGVNLCAGKALKGRAAEDGVDLRRPDEASAGA